MQTRLFVLNLPYFFSQSRLREALEGCNVTSIVLARTIYGVLASLETADQEDAKTAETILHSLKLPAPLEQARLDVAQQRLIVRQQESRGSRLKRVACQHE
jgi:hypothetical protein